MLRFIRQDMSSTGISYINTHTGQYAGAMLLQAQSQLDLADREFQIRLLIEKT